MIVLLETGFGKSVVRGTIHIMSNDGEPDVVERILVKR